MKPIRITQEGFSEQSLAVSPVYRDRPLTVALARSGIVLNTRCGQKGLCRGCEVRLESGAWIKACQVAAAEFEGSLIHIPERSLIRGSLSVAVDFLPRCAFELDPLFPRDNAKRAGLCIDIGTTTVVMALVDLGDGKILGRSSSYNAQVRMGEDVLTRIEACTHSPEAVLEGQRLILETLSALWKELSGVTGFSGKSLVGCVVAGNTTMLHLLLGEDPSPMGVVPFRPVFLDVQTRLQSDLPFADPVWAGAEGMPWHLLPGCSAFVGADIVAGWLSSGMADEDGTHLLVDMGTNGEILLQDKGRLIASATAAGPAFEGAQLSWGTRAIEGAVSRIHGNPLQPQSLEFEYVTRHTRKAGGFCGSAYIDFMALGIQSGLLQPNGRFDRDVAQTHGISLGRGSSATAGTWMRRTHTDPPSARLTSPSFFRPRRPSPRGSIFSSCRRDWKRPMSAMSSSGAASG
jgi:uncharacterized 2Fe-2S/4Fe-4S cluster protein (DUF4445 family)